MSRPVDATKPTSNHVSAHPKAGTKAHTHRAGEHRPLEGTQPTLRDHIATTIGSWRLVSAVMLSVLAGGGTYYAWKAPVYQADALVQVEEKQKGIAGLEELSEMMKMQSPAETEMEILRSRMLVGAVVDELGLEIRATPRYLPMIGQAAARRRSGSAPAPALFGQHRYAWGGERIVVKHFDMPPELRGKPFTLTARAGGAYDLYAPDHSFVATGIAGAPCNLPSLGTNASLVVQELVARPGTEFDVTRDPRLSAIESLQQRLTVAEKGKKTGVLRLSLEGTDPEELAHILDAAQATYVRLNIERKSAEAEKTLEFVEAQLPEMKRKLEAAEAALNDYRTKTGSVDVSLETKANLEQVGDVEKELTTLRMQLDESKGMFTSDHPMMVALQSKLRRVEGQRGMLDARFKRLPGSELENARLQRDVKVANELYVLFLNKSEELKVLKSGTIGSVRVLDAASVPMRPVGPALAVVLLASLVGGLLLGVGAAFAKKSLNVGVEDPDLIEAELALPVYATIPHSKVERRREKNLHRPGATSLIAATDPNDLAVEALRSMRTGLAFVLDKAKNNVVAICGPSPGCGKSFVAANLAQVLADAGRRVLLIDCDLRRGRLHERLGRGRESGLGDVIATVQDPSEVVSVIAPNLHFMSAGKVPTNPAELLAGARYDEVVAWASQTYDVVLVDTAPVLAVTDGALAARVAGTNLMVLRSGKHSVREVAAALKRLGQTGIDVDAAILNDVQARAGDAYSRYGHSYQYSYE